MNFDTNKTDTKSTIRIYQFKVDMTIFRRLCFVIESTFGY